jgi:hypothetical protein
LAREPPNFRLSHSLNRDFRRDSPKKVSRPKRAGECLKGGTGFADRCCVHKAMRGWVLLSSVKRYEMTVMSKEQIKRDERSLIIFLILFNIALAGAFLLACFYQS